MERAADPPSGPGAVIRCPACSAALTHPPRGLEPACPACGAPFRSPALGALLSVALPGCGHFYLRRRAVAAIELSIGLGLFAGALAGLGAAFLRVVNEEAPLWEMIRACLLWATILAAYSALDGLFTWTVSRRRVVLRSARENPS